MINSHESSGTFVKTMSQLLLYALLILIVAAVVSCVPMQNNAGEIQPVADLELETTLGFKLALSPDDQYLAILTWKAYARTLDDYGATSVRVRIIDVNTGSIVQAINLPDVHGRRVGDEVQMYWQNVTALRVYFSGAYYTLDPGSFDYVHDNGNDFVPSLTPNPSDECSWSPHQLYCASVSRGELRISDAKGYLVRQHYVCDSSYPICDENPLLWTSDDKLIFVDEFSIWTWDP